MRSDYLAVAATYVLANEDMDEDFRNLLEAFTTEIGGDPFGLMDTANPTPHLAVITAVNHRDATPAERKTLEGFYGDQGDCHAAVVTFVCASESAEFLGSTLKRLSDEFGATTTCCISPRAITPTPASGCCGATPTL